MSSNKTALTVVLALLTMIGPLGIDTYLPSFQAITREFQADPLTVQQTLSLYAVGMSVMMLFYGTLSDSFGRRPVVLVSLALFAGSSVWAALAPSVGALVLARLAQGLCSGAGGVIARAMVQDRFEGAEAQRMMATMMMVFGVAPAVAPVIGGWLQATLGWRWVFWFLAAFSSLLLALSLRVLEETLPAAGRSPFRLRGIAANYLRSLRSLPFMLMVCAVGLVFGGIGLYIGSASAYMINILHLPETAFAWLFVPLVAGLMIGSAVASRHAQGMPPERMLRLGFAIMIAATLASVAYTAWFVPAVPSATLPFMAYTFGLALASPGMSVISLSVFPEMRGLAASMQGFVQMMLFALISGLLAPLVFGSAQALAWTHLGLLVLGAAAWELGYARRPA